QADQIEQLAPRDFTSMDKDVRDKLALYQHYVNNLGLSGQEAAQRILDAQKPEKQASREVLRESLAKEQKALTLDDITKASGWFAFDGTDLPILPEQQNVLMAEYRERFAENYLTNGGNAEQAKALARRDVLQVWGPSGVSGGENLMRLPPEKYYPAIGGSHDY